MICVFPVFLGYIYVLYVYRRTLITQAQNTTHTKYRAVCLVSSCTVQPAASTASRYDPCITRDRRTVMHGPWLPKASSYGPCLLSAFCFVLLLLLLLCLLACVRCLRSLLAFVACVRCLRSLLAFVACFRCLLPSLLASLLPSLLASLLASFVACFLRCLLSLLASFVA